MHTRKGALSAENLDDMASRKAEAASLPDQGASGVSTTLSNARIPLNSHQSGENDGMPMSGTHMTIAATSNEDLERHPPLQDLSITSQGLWSLEATNHPELLPSDRDNLASVTDFDFQVLQKPQITSQEDREIQPLLEKQTLERLSNVSRHYCQQESCNKSFLRKGDLTRHTITAHQRPAVFVCHIHRCPRGIPGKGFARKDKLVDHLTSKKHGLNRDDAVYEATKNNTH
jgi:hypothetical protein